MAKLTPKRTFQFKRGDAMVIARQNEKIEISDDEHKKFSNGYFKEPYVAKKK